MEELALHILDIAENSIRAGADRIFIRIHPDPDRDLLTIEIIDNGKGMDESSIKYAKDPFYTTKPEKKVGLGLPLLSQAAEMSGGTVTVSSRPGKGTTVHAAFKYSHIDRQPLGNLEETLLTLIISHPEIQFIYQYENKIKKIDLDTQEVKSQVAPLLLNSAEGIRLLRRRLTLPKPERGLLHT